MNIGVVTPQYWPSRGPSALYFHALAYGLNEAGYKSIIFCTGSPSEEDGSLSNVKVVRAGAELGAGLRRWKRAVRLIHYHIKAFLFVASNRYRIKKWIIDGPLYWNAGAILAAILFKQRFVYLVHDIYPDVLISAGMLNKDGSLAKLLERLEHWPMNHACRIYTLSKGMSKIVRKRVKDKSKVSHHAFPIHPIFLRNFSRESASYPEKPVLLYAGGLGIAHELAPFSYWAKRLSNRGIVFRLVADYRGTQWEEKEYIKKTNPVSWDKLPRLYRSCSAGYVGLPVNWGEGSLPSKTFSILASGRPVIVVADKKSELYSLISDNGLGLALTHEEALSDKGVEKVQNFLLDRHCLIETFYKVAEYVRHQHSLKSITTNIVGR